MNTRRQFNARLGALAVLGPSGLGRAAFAQQSGVSQLVVGFPAGGSTDTVARRLADHLRGHYAPSVIVENKPGAGAQLAVVAVRNSPPDGSSLLLSPADVFALYPSTYKKLPYAAEDVVPVAPVCSLYGAFAVGPAVPSTVKTLGDFIGWVKDNPSKANFGSPATGSTLHLTGSLLGRMSGASLTHVAYRGDAPGLQDLAGGQIASYMTVLGSYLPHLKADRIRLLALAGTERSPFVPDVPTFREQGYDIVNLSGWFGVFLPARTPAAIVDRAARAIQSAVDQPSFVQGLADYGMTPLSLTPQAMAERLRGETAAWQEHVRQLGFSVES